MAKRKKSPAQQIEERLCDLGCEQKRWGEIAKNGSSDLWYPDGIGLNLVRNHIIYDICTIKDLCSENGIPIPDGFDETIPQEVDQNYMVDPTSERAKRIFAHRE
jgi:hypothetical protein